MLKHNCHNNKALREREIREGGGSERRGGGVVPHIEGVVSITTLYHKSFLFRGCTSIISPKTKCVSSMLSVVIVVFIQFPLALTEIESWRSRR